MRYFLQNHSIYSNYKFGTVRSRRSYTGRTNDCQFTFSLCV